MPDLTLTVPVYVNLDPGGPVLVRSSTNQLPLGPLRVVSGDERLFSFRLHQTPEGSTWQRVGLPSGWTMVLSGKLAPGGETAYFTNSTWTSTGSGSTLAYTATLDWAVSDSVWANAPDGVVPFRMDLEIRDATNTVRGTVQFDLELSRENYGSGDTPDDPDSPFLDRTAADNIYLSFAAAQTLTDEQADQAISNLKGTTASTPNRLAKRTSLGWLLARAFDTDDENNGIRIQGLRHGTVTVSVAGAADQYVFDAEAFPPTGITAGMYLFGGFPEGTTVIDIDGGIITTSAGLLASGTVTVFASTSAADPRPKLTLTREGTPILTIAHDGTLTGPAATLGNLVVNGGPFQVDVDGNITTNGSFVPQGPIYLNAGAQGIEHSAYSMLGLDDQGNPTFGIYSQSGAATFTGDMWLGAWSGTGQGLLLNRTGIWGYDSGSGNTFGFDTSTGLLIANSLQLASYTLTLGGNVAFAAFGRTLAATATAIAANDALQTIGNSIASAATTSIAAATGRAVTITGTTNITSFGTCTAGPTRLLTFAGRLYISHHATDLILPDGIPLLVQAGDTIELLPYATNQWRLIRHIPAKSKRPIRVITADNASWTPTTGSGTVAVNTYTSGVRKQQIAGNTAGLARAVFTTGTEANYLPGSVTTVNYSKAFRLRFTAQVYLPPTTPATARVTFHLAGIAAPTHDLTERGLAIQYLGNGTAPTVRIQSYDTSATNGTAVVQSAQDTSPHDYEFVWYPNLGGYLLIDGTLVATITTGLASGSGTSGSTRFALCTENVAGTSDASLLRVCSPIAIEPLE